MKRLKMKTGLATLIAGSIISMSAIAQEPKSGGHVFFHSEESETHTRGPMKSQFMLSAEQTEGRYSIVSEEFGTGFSSFPGHTHLYHSEVFYVVSGTMEWTVDEDTQEVGPGDLVYIPPGSPHAGRVISDEPVKALMLYEPAGYEKNYFKRQSLTEEELRTPSVIRELMEQADVHLTPQQ